MTRIGDLLAAGRTLSFEFFPPKTDEGVQSLRRVLDELAAFRPSFVSVTYGAGGSTKDRTRDIVLDINSTRPFPAMPHLTCMSHTKDEVVELLQDYRVHAIDNILALAGDPPADGTPPAGEFRYALELVGLVREQGDFSIGVAAFPEVHPRSPDRATDRRHLAAKLEAADFAITQFFYDADDYFRLIDELDALGTRKPVIPGVLPPMAPASVRRFAAINGTRTPDDVLERIDAAPPDEAKAIAADVATELARTLLEAGAPGIHLYALNRSDVPSRVVANIRDLV
ncbi:MAG TPA: methylenetetrahydrofolate reductase [Acidimicrobiales bacterium]